MVLKVQLLFFLHPPPLYLTQAPAVNRPYICAAPDFVSQSWSYRAETPCSASFVVVGFPGPPDWMSFSPASLKLVCSWSWP